MRVRGTSVLCLAASRSRSSSSSWSYAARDRSNLTDSCADADTSTPTAAGHPPAGVATALARARPPSYLVADALLHPPLLARPRRPRLVLRSVRAQLFDLGHCLRQLGPQLLVPLRGAVSDAGVPLRRARAPWPTRHRARRVAPRSPATSRTRLQRPASREAHRLSTSSQAARRLPAPPRTRPPYDAPPPPGAARTSPLRPCRPPRSPQIGRAHV